MYKFGDVILAQVQYIDTFEIKNRPALVLFEEYGNVVCAGITSNLEMEGILLKKSEGVVADSVIKLNSIITITEEMVKRKLFSLNSEKKNIVRKELVAKLNEQ